MEKYSDWSWFQLSILYRNSPSLELDFYNPPASNDKSDQQLGVEVLTEQDRITEENNENP